MSTDPLIIIIHFEKNEERYTSTANGPNFVKFEKIKHSFADELWDI